MKLLGYLTAMYLAFLGIVALAGVVVALVS